MSTITVQGLNVLAVYVTDIEISESFYRDHLGFERTQEMPPGILIKSGELTLYLESNRRTKRPKLSGAAEFSPEILSEVVDDGGRSPEN
ncbi:MAG: VOC family protein [Planctomycetota bacterium]|jgi:catechol 2,3-dioxygenase-like lactoylglutathione lyase family enzyme|nr:VOC family protein [Planctomycetota bacterium]